MIKMVLFVQGLIGTVKAIASEVCDNTNQVDSDKFSKSWTYFTARHAIFHTHFQTCTQFANPLSCPFSISQHTFQAVFFFIVVFELNVLIHSEVKSQISLCALMVSLKTILSWIQNLYIPLFRPKLLKIHEWHIPITHIGECFRPTGVKCNTY